MKLSHLAFLFVPLLSAEVTDAHRAEYWQARAEAAEAALALNNAQTKLQAAVAEMTKACGKSAIVVDKKTGKLTCEAPAPVAEKPDAQ